jgi:putative ATPase
MPDFDLFDYARQQGQKKQMPLAARMRPRNFDEFVGQANVVGKGKLLRRAIEADQLTSLILWGPPGSGKTTISAIIANSTQRQFLTLNAVTDGVNQLRDVIKSAKDQLGMYGKGTVLFIDEIHRWNKIQQDALLPYVEDGTVVLIGSTTENPFFSLVNALISRSRVIRLETLTADDIKQVLVQAIGDKERGYGDLKIEATDDALEHLAVMAGGDARNALNALELAVKTTAPDKNSVIRIDIEVAQESIQRRVLRYDRGDDEHYDTASAFIKSLRGSDVDAALYWMAKMIHAGEEPRFVFRRMLILTCEDIGMADPQALVVVNAAAEAFERIGMPEGYYLLSQACIYCALAPKSNSAGAIFKAVAHIEQHGVGDVPTHLRDKSDTFRGTTRDRYKQAMGDMGKYLYPHDYPHGWVAQQYLPENMEPPNWYQPRENGYEAEVSEDWRRRRGE